MSGDRRGEQRYVVDGLQVSVDGTTCDILDVSNSRVRIFWEGPAAPPDEVRLRFTAEPGFPPLDFTAHGWLQRGVAQEVVYAYEPPEDWARRLPAFDAFSDFAVADLEA